MIYNAGDIIEIKNFQLPTIQKNKFFIFITDSLLVPQMWMTTSKQYFNPEHIKHGLMKVNDYYYHCFKAHITIGINGFFFYKDTFIKTQDNGFPYTNKYNDLTIIYHDRLNDKEYYDLVYTIYQSPYTKNKVKIILEDILNKLP